MTNTELQAAIDKLCETICEIVDGMIVQVKQQQEDLRAIKRAFGVEDNG